MATKKAKAKKVEATTVNKIKATATKVNKNVQATADVAVKEMVENTSVVKNVAEKAAKELTKKVDFKDTTKQVKATVETVNSQVKEVAGVVMKSGKQMTTTAVKAAKETIQNIDVEKGMKTVASTAKNVNDYSLKTADQLVDGALENSEKWGKVAEKAINGGLKLAEKNQEMVFTTLETIKTQMMSSAVRFSRLFSKN